MIRVVLIFIGLFCKSNGWGQPTGSAGTQGGPSSIREIRDAREGMFRRSEVAKKIADERRKEILDSQTNFRKRRQSLTENYERELRKIEKEENSAITEINRKHEDLAKKNAKKPTLVPATTTTTQTPSL